MSDRAGLGGGWPAGAGGPIDARLDATVVGRVQGVGFRWFVLDAAERLELRGWVANEPDGSVRCVAEGPREQLEALLAALQRGPLNARVDRVISRWGPPSGTLGPFDIRSGHHGGD
jgi:acylphosphatase